MIDNSLFNFKNIKKINYYLISLFFVIFSLAFINLLFLQFNIELTFIWNLNILLIVLIDLTALLLISELFIDRNKNKRQFSVIISWVSFTLTSYLLLTFTNAQEIFIYGISEEIVIKQKNSLITFNIGIIYLILYGFLLNYFLLKVDQINIKGIFRMLSNSYMILIFGIIFGFLFSFFVLFTISFVTNLSLFISLMIPIFAFGWGIFMFNFLLLETYVIVIYGLVFSCILFVLLIKTKTDKETSKTKIIIDNKTKLLLESIGGLENIIEVNSCVTRLRLTVKDISKINDDKLKQIGALGVIKLSKNNVQIIFNEKSEYYRNKIATLLKTAI